MHKPILTLLKSHLTKRLGGIIGDMIKMTSRFMAGKYQGVLPAAVSLFIRKSIHTINLVCVVVVVSPILYYSQVIEAQVGTREQAIKLMQMGRYSQAEKIWRQLALTNPSNASVYANLGLALAHRGDYPDAGAEYRKALAINPHLPDVEFDLGLAEFKQGHFAVAASAFQSVAVVRPTDSRIQMLLGMSYYGEHKYSKAIPYLSTVDKLQPSNLELHYILAESCLRCKKIQCALDKSKQILELNPESAQAHMLLGEALDGTNKTKAAIIEFLAAERVAPNEPGVHFGLGYLYWELHDYDRATPEFELELKNDPNNAESDTYLGDIAYRSNDDASAESLLTKAIHLQTGIRLSYFDLGCVEARQKRDSEAIAAFRLAEKLDPHNPDAHYRLGRIYMSLDRKQEADEEFSKTSTLNQKAKESLIDKISGKTTARLK